jgi:hypothetical protein
VQHGPCRTDDAPPIRVRTMGSGPPVERTAGLQSGGLLDSNTRRREDGLQSQGRCTSNTRGLLDSNRRRRPPFFVDDERNVGGGVGIVDRNTSRRNPHTNRHLTAGDGGGILQTFHAAMGGRRALKCKMSSDLLRAVGCGSNGSCGSLQSLHRVPGLHRMCCLESRPGY